MKRDIDLIRKLLLYLEEKTDDKVIKDIELDVRNSGDIHDKFCQGENGDFP
jgi:hypothetical protein